MKLYIFAAALVFATPALGQDLRPEMRAPLKVVVTAVKESFRAIARPASVVEEGEKAEALRIAGAVCGNPAIQGKSIPAIPGKIAGCGVERPVRVTSVSGIKLSTGAIMDCRTAKAFNAWVANGVKPAFGSYRGGVRELKIAAHYACRTRNNQAGAKISEHGKGRAVDISEFRMNDGSKITLLQDWGKGRPGRILRTLHQKACGPFGTVLGPESNRFHLDHFHFDTARYRSGSYCR